MKTKFRLIACALALTSVASVAHAEEKRNAVSLSGNISSSSDFSQANVNAGYERLLTDKLSLSVNVLYLKSKFGGTSFDSTGVTGGATYYIGQPMQSSNMLFYGKAVVGTTHTSGAGSESLFGGFGGLEQPMGENTSLFEELGFQHTKFAGENLNQVVFNFGLKLRF